MVDSNCCIVGRSENRKEYERLRLMENKSYKRLENISKSKYGEDISHQAFWKHFNNHDLLYGDMSDEQKNELKDEIDDTIDTIKELKANVKILRRMVNSIIEKETEDLELNDMKAAKNLLTEIRQTLKTLQGMTNELQFGDEYSDDEIEDFYSALDALDPEYQKEIVEQIEANR
mgnify:CR=1 FL=1